MIKVEVKGMDRLKNKLTNIANKLPAAAESGIKKALENTSKYAIAFAPGSVANAIKLELVDKGTGEVIAGRVFNDVGMLPWSSYIEFGTGAYVDDQGNDEAIRLKVSTKIPWYIHVSMVPESFAKYNYPLVTGRNGEQYWEVLGAHPRPYMHPAAFAARDDNINAVAEAIHQMIGLVVG